MDAEDVTTLAILFQSECMCLTIRHESLVLGYEGLKMCIVLLEGTFTQHSCDVCDS